MATIGPAQSASQTFRGTWSAEIVPGKPNVGNGSWGVFDENGRMVMNGTWSAKKDETGWHGTFTASIPHGRSVSGSWKAGMSGSPAKTFEDMLKRALEKEVPGSWRVGEQEGNWWLRKLESAK